jgi:hypothetical protein
VRVCVCVCVCATYKALLSGLIWWPGLQAPELNARGLPLLRFSMECRRLLNRLPMPVRKEACSGATGTPGLKICCDDAGSCT